MATTNVYGTGEHDGNVLSTGASGAFRYVNIWEATFNESTGNTVIKYNIGTWVDYGNFYGSNFQSWGTFGDESYTVDDASGNPYGWHQGSTTVPYNGSKRFQEGCGYNSSSSGWLESSLDVTWRPTLPTYAVTYNKNTTASVSNMPSSQTKTWGTALTLSSSAPTRSGYTFKGWATSSSATTATYQPGATYSTNKAVTLYAVWKVDTYPITYHANGHGSDPSSQTKTYGVDITLRGAMSTTNSYVFKEWNTKADGTGTTYAAGATYSTNASLTLYAIWRNPYTISYDANGGSGAPSSQKKAYGSSVTLTTATPTRTGYSFKGWATSKARADAGTVDYQPGATYNTNANLTLYAAWNINTWVVTYKPNGGSGSQFTAVKEYNVALTLASSGFTRTHYTLSKWNTSADGGGTSYSLGYSYTKNANLTLYAIWKLDAPSTPTSFSVTRNSDTKATLTWTRPSDASTTWQKVYIYRSVDGGSYQNIANVAGTATSYADTTTTADHSYTYRIRSYNSDGGGQYSSYATSSTIYNTPAAPSAIAATRAGSASTNVTITLTNTAHTATGYEIECSTDGSTWTTGGMTVTSATGTPVTSISVTMSSGGSYYFRVRNTRSSLKSAWATSGIVVTVTPPNPPTLVTPASGSVVQYGSSSATTVSFEWQHNSIDGSPQTAAQLRYSTDGGSSWVETITLTTAEEYTLSHAFSVNDSVTWQVRTKGAADSYGNWSATSTFAVYEKPSLSVTFPGPTIGDVPIPYTVAYTDASGSFSSGTVKVMRGSTTLYTKVLAPPYNGNLVGEIGPGEFLPDNSATYRLRFDVKSTSTLSATASTDFYVEMNVPSDGSLAITNDPGNGYVYLTATFDNDASDIDYSGNTNQQYDTQQGSVKSLEVLGKTERWNQLVNVPYASASTTSGAGLTYELSDNGRYLKVSGVREGNTSWNFINYSDIGIKAGHKFYIGKFDEIANCAVRVYGRDTTTVYIDLKTNAAIFTAASTSTDTAVFMTATNSISTNTNVSLKGALQIFDLTAIFGAGNEPSTVAEFESSDVYQAKLASGELNDYDPGSLVSIGNTSLIGRNLSPFFAHSFTDVYNATSNPNGYWKSLGTTYLTQGSDGWAHFECDNSNSGSTAYCNFTITAQNKPLNFKPSTTYTFVIEAKNVQASTTFQIYATSNVQAQPSMFAENVSKNTSGDYVEYVTVLSKADLTGIDLFTRGYISVPARASASADFRISLYEGTYTGGFEPYMAPQTITTPIRSAGTAHDVLKAGKTSWTVERHIGYVDLGTISWVRASTSTADIYRVRSANVLSGVLKPSANNVNANILCAKYKTTNASASYTKVEGIDIGSDGYIHIYDTSFNTGTSEEISAAAHTATNGVILYYELETPTTDASTSISTMQVGTALTVETELDSTFELTTWNGDVEAVSLSVFRVNPDGTRKLLLERGESGAGILDMYAPLNTPYSYEVVTYGANEAIATTTHPNVLRSGWWFVYWDGKVAKAKWNPNGTKSVSRPQQELVDYIGRKFPVSYDGTAVREEGSTDFQIIDREYAKAFYDMVAERGSGVYKSGDGEVFHANFQNIRTSSTHHRNQPYGTLTLPFTRIDGEAL